MWIIALALKIVLVVVLLIFVGFPVSLILLSPAILLYQKASELDFFDELAGFRLWLQVVWLIWAVFITYSAYRIFFLITK